MFLLAVDCLFFGGGTSQCLRGKGCGHALCVKLHEVHISSGIVLQIL